MDWLGAPDQGARTSPLRPLGRNGRPLGRGREIELTMPRRATTVGHSHAAVGRTFLPRLPIGPGSPGVSSPSRSSSYHRQRSQAKEHKGASAGPLPPLPTDYHVADCRGSQSRLCGREQDGWPGLGVPKRPTSLLRRKTKHLSLCFDHLLRHVRTHVCTCRCV
jgi:hypothetical protein